MPRTPYYEPDDPRENPTGLVTVDPGGMPSSAPQASADDTANAHAADVARGAAEGDMGPIKYGNSAGGAAAASKEWDDLSAANTYAKNGLAAGANWANAEAGRNRGAMAQENQGLANNFAGGANGNQAGAMGLAKSMAMGNSPSQAAYQLQDGLNQGLAQQSSIANSARGAGSMATAGSNAGYNQAAMQQNAFSQAGQLRAQDMAAGRGLYASMTDQERGQAGERMGQANDMAAGNATGNTSDRELVFMNIDNAGVNFGKVGNRMNGQDLSDMQHGHDPSMLEDDSNQDYQVYLANKRKTAESNYKQDNG